MTQLEIHNMYNKICTLNIHEIEDVVYNEIAKDEEICGSILLGTIPNFYFLRGILNGDTSAEKK